MTIPREARSLSGRDIGRTVNGESTLPAGNHRAAAGELIGIQHYGGAFVVLEIAHRGTIPFRPTDILHVTGTPSPKEQP